MKKNQKPKSVGVIDPDAPHFRSLESLTRGMTAIERARYIVQLVGSLPQAKHTEFGLQPPEARPHTTHKNRRR